MDGIHESPPPRFIDAAAKAAFLAALGNGARREDAAAQAGFSLTGFYGARRRDPQFAADWTRAIATPEAGERRRGSYAARGRGACPGRGPGEVRIASANRRPVQRQRRAHVRFTLDRREIYLEHFAATGDATASAAAAGVSESTVTLHRRTDPAFDAACREALAIACPRLEEEALRLGRAAQLRYRAAVERGATAAPPRSAQACPCCGHSPDEEAVFDRIMRLLARRDRRERRVETRFAEGGRRQRGTFQEGIAWLDRSLRALGVRWGIESEGMETARRSSEGGE